MVGVPHTRLQGKPKSVHHSPVCDKLTSQVCSNQYLSVITDNIFSWMIYAYQKLNIRE